LRLGQVQEVIPLVTFLYQEWQRQEEETGGAVAHALAVGLHVIGIQGEAERQYQWAIDAYDRDGNDRGSAEIVLEWMARMAPEMNEVMWSEYTLRLGHRVQRGALPLAALNYLSALRAYSKGNAEAAYRSLTAEDKVGVLPYPYDIASMVLAARAAYAVDHSEASSLGLTVDRLKLMASIDLELQMEGLLFAFERAVKDGEEENATPLLAQIRCLCGMGMLPERVLQVERLAARFSETLASRASVAEAVETSEKELYKPIYAEAAAEIALSSTATEDVEVFRTAGVGQKGWRVRLFGEMTLSRNNQELRLIHWKRKKTQELFFYLLLQPHYAATREQVIESLYPEGEPDKMVNRLYVSIHELKRQVQELTGYEGGVTLRDGLLRISEDLFEMVDVEQYLALVRIGNQLWLVDRELSSDMYEKAVHMYEAILPEMPYTDWLNSIRNDVIEKQAIALQRLGQWAEAEGSKESAEAYYREWIRLQPFQEEAYQHMLALLARERKQAKAMRLYEEWKELLHREMGVVPLSETTKLLEVFY
jgi:two-component SAPR family response regulator